MYNFINHFYMKRTLPIVFISLMMGGFCIYATAQEKLPNSSISFMGAADLNGGYEMSLGSEYYFNSNHKVSLYGLFNYHFAKELWLGESVSCKKAMMEIGGKKYFAVVKEKFYPYVGLGVAIGVQDLTQNTFVNFSTSIINKDEDYFILGGVGTLGLEYMLTKNVAIDVACRFKYDDVMHYVLGGGLKFSF